MENLKELQKEEYVIYYSNRLVDRKRSLYGLFLVDRCKRNKSQRLAPFPILRCSSCHPRPDLPVPEPDGNTEYSSDSEHSDMIVVTGDDTYKPEEDDQPEPLTQATLNDLTGDLNLSKLSAQLLGSRLKRKDLLAWGMFYWYQNREN